MMTMSMKTQIKQAVFRYPPFANQFYRAMYFLKSLGAHEPDALEANVNDAVFLEIYESNYWGDAESVSGSGSSLRATEQIRRDLPPLLASLGIRSLLDAPCGDFNWMREVVAQSNYHYTGGDIIGPLIERLQATHGAPNRRFEILDIVAQPLPAADLWLCRDCLIHLPYERIRAAIENFKKSNVSYLLTTQYDFPRRNRDIPIGKFRYLNLRRPPFNFPPPIAAVFDYHYPHAPRKLALWRREQLLSV